MVLHFRVSGGRICECGFVTFGCPPATAAWSMVTEMVKGKTVLEALGITANELEQALGGLPMGKGGCAALAVQALRDAFW